MNIEMIATAALGIVLFWVMIRLGLYVLSWFQTRD